MTPRIFHISFLFLISSLFLKASDSPVRQVKAISYKDSLVVSKLLWDARILSETDFMLSVLLSEEALVISETNNYLRGEATANVILGKVLFNYYNRYGLAMKCFAKALLSAQKIHDNKLIAYSEIGMGEINRIEGRMKKAAVYLHDALRIAKSEADVDLRLYSYNAIGNYYLAVDSISIARSYYLTGFNLAKDGKSENWLCKFKNRIANCYLNDEDHTLAVAQNLEALQLAEDADNVIEKTVSLKQIAKLYQQRGENEKALTYANLGLNWASLYKLKKQKMEFFEMHYDLYNKMHKTDSALKFLKKYYELKDTIYSRLSIERFVVAELNYELNRKQMIEENELNEAQKEGRRREFIQYMIIGLISMLFIIVLITSRKFKFSERLSEFIVFSAILLFFEFILVLLHPGVIKVTHGNPILLLIFNLIVSVFVHPFHHFLSEKVKTRLKKNGNNL